MALVSPTDASEMVILTLWPVGEGIGVAGVTEITVGDSWVLIAVGDPDLEMNVDGLGVLVLSSWITGMILLEWRTAESPHRSRSTEVTSWDSWDWSRP